MWNLSKMDVNTQSFQSVWLGRSGKADSNKYPLTTFPFKSLISQGKALISQNKMLLLWEMRLDW